MKYLQIKIGYRSRPSDTDHDLELEYWYSHSTMRKPGAQITAWRASIEILLSEEKSEPKASRRAFRDS